MSVMQKATPNIKQENMAAIAQFSPVKSNRAYKFVHNNTVDKLLRGHLKRSQRPRRE